MAMERTTMRTMGATSAALSSPFSTASANTTNANSPPGATYSPERIAAIVEWPSGFEMSIIKIVHIGIIAVKYLIGRVLS